MYNPLCYGGLCHLFVFICFVVFTTKPTIISLCSHSSTPSVDVSSHIRYGLKNISILLMNVMILYFSSKIYTLFALNTVSFFAISKRSDIFVHYIICQCVYFVAIVRAMYYLLSIEACFFFHFSLIKNNICCVWTH